MVELLLCGEPGALHRYTPLHTQSLSLSLSLSLYVCVCVCVPLPTLLLHDQIVDMMPFWTAGLRV
jgi:hypothetical protein